MSPQKESMEELSGLKYGGLTSHISWIENKPRFLLVETLFTLLGIGK